MFEAKVTVNNTLGCLNVLFTCQLEIGSYAISLCKCNNDFPILTFFFILAC